MENNIRFRNHVSVILENSLKALGTIFAIFLFNMISDVGEAGITGEDILWLIGGLLVAFVIVLGWQGILWAKTYISIQDNSLVVERNTLNKKKNTIGLKSISNVNLEQNLFEMLIGTCRLKLDTNSLSTADETDVNIVLKRTDAERFRQILLGEEEAATTETEDIVEDTEVSKQLQKHESDIGDIIVHGLFSIRIVSLIFLIGITASEAFLIVTADESIIEILVNTIAILWLAVGIIWNMIKEFIKYIGFKIERKGDKIFLAYGLVKKVAYSIPIDKINAIKLTQTPIARMGKRYMVEVINVGMDDGENEVNTFFLPYAKIGKIREQLHMLLPEFDGCIDIKEEKQPPVIWLLWSSSVLTYLAGVALAYAIVAEFTPELKVPVLCAAGIIGLLGVISKAASFLTRGVSVDENLLKIVNGRFAKQTLFVKYEKIQYVTTKQCIIAKHFGIQRGQLWLLASLKNRLQDLPYFKEETLEELKNHLI